MELRPTSRELSDREWDGDKEEDRQSNRSSRGRQVGAEDRGGETERQREREKERERERDRARRADPLKDDKHSESNKTLYFSRNRYGTVLIGVFETYLVLNEIFHNNMNGTRAKLCTLS